MDMFVLTLDASGGSETCLYSDGTAADDGVTALLVQDRTPGLPEGSNIFRYPSIVVGGYTGGSLAGPNGEAPGKG